LGHNGEAEIYTAFHQGASQLPQFFLFHPLHIIEMMLNWFDRLCLYCRLHANDRVDSFVAVYDPPAPSYVGKITHLQWKGLLSPEFVKQVLDLIM